MGKNDKKQNKELDLAVEAARIGTDLDAVILGIGHYILAARETVEGAHLMTELGDTVVKAIENNYLMEYVRFTYGEENISSTKKLTPFAEKAIHFIEEEIDNGPGLTKRTVEFIEKSYEYKQFVENFLYWLEENDFDVTKTFDKIRYEIEEKFAEYPYVTNLNAKVQDNPPILIGRESEIVLLSEALLKKNKANACLIGEAGVGKTAIVEGLAQKINEGNVSVGLKGKVILEVSISQMLSGTRYRGDFEQRMTNLLKELETAPNVILFIDEFHTIMDAGASEGSTSASNILKPALARGDIKMIGATTYDEYQKFVSKDKAFERRFETIFVKEPSIQETREILNGLKKSFENFHGLKIDDDAIDCVINNTNKYMANRYFPDKAIDILDSACVSAKVVEAKAVTKKDIIKTIERKTGVKIVTTKKLDLPKEFKKVIKGQDEVITDISEILDLIDMGLIDSDKPMATLMFAGPTGVGKTEMAKQIAKIYFGSEDRLVRVDMSEYTAESDVSKLLGAAPGYVGYDKESTIISGVKKQPYSVVLLDEIEKASSKVLETLLQMLDEGFITSAQGEKVDFRHTIIIMTSNIGFHNNDSKAISFGSTKDKENKNIDEAIKGKFAPEFLNRIDKIMMFNRLNKDVVKDIANDYAKTFGYSINDADVDEIIKEADVETQGARSVKRIVRTKILPKKVKENKVGITVL